MSGDGGPAFPHSTDRVFHPAEGALDPRTGSWGPSMTGGMSLRDYFAAAALQSMHSGTADIFTASLMPPERADPGEERDYIIKRLSALAESVYAIADAMLAERDKAAP